MFEVRLVEVLMVDVPAIRQRAAGHELPHNARDIFSLVGTSAEARVVFRRVKSPCSKRVTIALLHIVSPG